MVPTVARRRRGALPSPREGRSVARPWVRRLRDDPKSAFADWDAYCQSPTGVRVVTRFVAVRPPLPPVLAAARQRLRRAVPDERDEAAPTRPFNGPRYCLRRVVREVRRRGEIPGCQLTFGPSDYRTCLVTNGIDSAWARRAGLRGFCGTQDWVARFDGAADHNRFFRNSFGVNVLVSVVDERGRRVLLFRQRSDLCAVRPRTTVGSADEGLRRHYQRTRFDERGATDPAPDIDRCARRAVMEELGLGADDVDESSPSLLSVGIVRSLAQPAALFYWALPMSRAQLELRLHAASDRHLEFGAHHYVPLDWNSVVAFVRRQEPVAPVESWVVAAALYAVTAKPPPSVFVSYASADRRRARELGAALRRRGAHVWRDDDFLRVGADWRERVTDRLRLVDCMVVLMSRAAAASQNVAWEVARARRLAARGARRPRVLVALVEDHRRVPRPAWRRRDDVFADLARRAARRRELERLADAVRESVSS